MLKRRKIRRQDLKTLGHLRQLMPFSAETIKHTELRGLVTMIMEFFSFPVNTSKEQQIIGPDPSVLTRRSIPQARSPLVVICGPPGGTDQQ